MKCSKCGSEIKKGNLYCSDCGAEVQIVSAYNVMEDEFFLDVQHQTAGEAGTEQQGELSEELSCEMPRAMRRRNLCLGMSAAALGFCVLLFFAFFVLRKDADVVSAARGSYEQAVEAMAQSDFAKAEQAFAGAKAKQPEELSNYFWQAWLQGQQGKTDAQKETLKAILLLDRENIYACKELIGIYVDQGDFEALHALSDVYEDSRLSALFSEY